MRGVGNEPAERLVPHVERTGGDLALGVLPEVEEQVLAPGLAPDVVGVEQPVELLQLLGPEHVLDHEESLKIEQVAFLLRHGAPTHRAAPARSGNPGAGAQSGVRAQALSRAILSVNAGTFSPSGMCRRAQRHRAAPAGGAVRASGRSQPRRRAGGRPSRSPRGRPWRYRPTKAMWPGVYRRSRARRSCSAVQGRVPWVRTSVKMIAEPARYGMRWSHGPGSSRFRKLSGQRSCSCGCPAPPRSPRHWDRRRTARTPPR